MHSANEDLPFLPKRKSKLHKEYEYKVSNDIKKTHRKVYKTFNITHESQNKLIATTQDKNKYVMNIPTLKQALNHNFKVTKGT